MKNLLIAGLLICTLPHNVFSQTDSTVKFKNNAVYAELLGNMGGLSLNYERKIYEHERGFFTARIGFGYGGIDLVGFPILLNHVFSKRNNHFEIGFGMRLVTAHYISYTHFYRLAIDKDYSIPTANFSYRYQKPNGKFIFRAGWTPLFYVNTYDNDGYRVLIAFISCGISAGYIF